MLFVEIDETNGTAVLKPGGPLSKTDFELAAKIIDPYIEDSRSLNGLIIHVEEQPGGHFLRCLSL